MDPNGRRPSARAIASSCPGNAHTWSQKLPCSSLGALVAIEPSPGSQGRRPGSSASIAFPSFAGETVTGETSTTTSPTIWPPSLTWTGSLLSLRRPNWSTGVGVPCCPVADCPAPRSAASSLPVQAETPTDTAMGQAPWPARHRHPAHRVGSWAANEPRKNHLAVLHAAELLWREGLLFTVVFVGGHSWNSAPFESQLEAVPCAAPAASQIILGPARRPALGRPAARPTAPSSPPSTKATGCP